MATFVRMQQRSLTEENAILSKWYVAEGDLVKEGQYIYAMETGKASFDVEAEASGTILKILISEGEEVAVRTIVCVIGNPGETYVFPDDDAPVGAAPEAAAPVAVAPAVEKSPAELPVAPVAVEKTVAGRFLISPRARRLALAHGLDYGGLCGTGPGGRILEEDVIAALAASALAASALAARPAEVSIARATALPPSLQGTAQFTIHAHCDASELLSYCERWNSIKKEPKQTVEDLVALAVNRLLPRFPCLNADGAFTILNIGAWGADFFTPIIYPPQTGILGIGAIEYRRKKTSLGMEDSRRGLHTPPLCGDIRACNPRPIPYENNIPCCPAAGYVDYPALALSLTVDHRSVDDTSTKAFLKALCEGLENFSLLLLV